MPLATKLHGQMSRTGDVAINTSWKNYRNKYPLARARKLRAHDVGNVGYSALAWLVI
jgi:hypothetical protein